MSDPHARLEEAFGRAISAIGAPADAAIGPFSRPSQNPQFGDYQVSVAMALAKTMGRKPRDIATEIVQTLGSDLDDLIEPPQIAGPGFINIRLKNEALGEALAAMERADLGVPRVSDSHTVVVDLCSVNVAKSMHVGHLRSTIIGDAIARANERIGRKVIRQNHLGDWGLQIGMVLHQLRAANVNLDSLTIDELEHAYRGAQLACQSDEQGLEAAMRMHAGPHRLIELREQNEGAKELLRAVKRTLVGLQRGDDELVRDWKKLIRVTMKSVYEIINLLGVQLDQSTERGESFYRDRLADVVQAFIREGIAGEHEGAVVVPFDDRERPMLIRKSDGGFLYSTTDLAAIRYRVRELNADRVIYVVDARQRDHFKDVFDAVRLAGWDTSDDGQRAQLVHLPFGSVLGEDKRPLKTRSGENVSLGSLLNEAIRRGTAEVTKRAAEPGAPTHGLNEADLIEIGAAVGIGAVKYADLSNDLVRDYVFSFDRMIAFEGNTGPYIQYAHARICSIFQKAGVDTALLALSRILIDSSEEKSLALTLLRYGGVVRSVAETLEPHRLCAYLFEVANSYSTFYQNCPVLKAETDELMNSRLRLCHCTRLVLADGLKILGIETPMRM